MQDDIRPENSVVLLLTACIDPRNVIAVGRRDITIRLEDYKLALRLWLKDSNIKKIVFCENSGHDLKELQNIYHNENRSNTQVEFLSFEGQSFPAHLGKGYGEMGIVSFAVQNSQLISPDIYVLKVTGRLYIPNIGDLLKRIDWSQSLDIYCDLRRNLTSADSRLFCASVKFLQNYLIPMQELINDSDGVYFENVLSRAVHRAMADGLRWAMLPCAHAMRGIGGTSNEPLPFSRLNLLRREMFRRIKAAIMAR